MNKQAFPVGAFFFVAIIGGQGVVRILKPEFPDLFGPVRAYLTGWVTWKDLVIALITACWLSVVIAAASVWLIDSIYELFKWRHLSHRVERTISVSLTAITFPIMVWAMLLLSHAVSGWDWNAQVFETEQRHPSLQSRSAEREPIVITMTPEEAAEIFDSLERSSELSTDAAQPEILHYDINGNLIE